MRSSSERTSLNLPPGPAPLPILGHLHRIDRTFPHRSLSQLSSKHGPIMQLQLGIRPTVVISSARLAAELFKSHDAVISHRPSLVSNRTLTYNFLDVVLSPENGEYWKNMKKFLFTNLLNTKTVQQFRPIREREVWRMISSISGSCTHDHHRQQQHINLVEMLEGLVTNVLLASAFGIGVEGSEKERAEMRRIDLRAVDMVNRIFIEDLVPWLRWMDVVGGFYSELDKAFRHLDAFYEWVIEAHLDPMRPKKEREDSVDVLLRIQKESNLTRDHVKGMLMVRYPN
ncbi:hypothetical protein ACLOJK_028660 [Asimina triloba]